MIVDAKFLAGLDDRIKAMKDDIDARDRFALQSGFAVMPRDALLPFYLTIEQVEYLYTIVPAMPKKEPPQHTDPFNKGQTDE